MEVTYKRSMSCNYILLQEKGTEYRESYQTHILTENRVPGLLPCKLQKIDGQQVFYYEITGCQSVENIFLSKKFGRQDLAELFSAAVRTAEALDEYLLNRDFLILEPAYIYRNLDKNRYMFLYFPYRNQTVEKGFRELTEYLLPRIHHEDKSAVAIGYGIYKEAVEYGFCTERLKKILFSEGEEDPENKKGEEKAECDERERERQRILDDFYKEEEEETTSVSDKIILTAGIITAAVFVFLIRNFTAIPRGVLWGITAVFAGGAAFLFALKKGQWIKGRRIKEQADKNFYDRKPYREKREPTFRGEEEEAYTAGREEQEEEVSQIGNTVVLGRQEGDKKGNAYLQEADFSVGKQYFLQKPVNIIGQMEGTADIFLKIPTVSRIHAKIIRREEGDFLVDLNSRNGTLLNGTCLEPEREYLLQNTDVVTFAQSKFYYISCSSSWPSQ